VDLHLHRVHFLVRFATAEEISVFQPDNHAPAHHAHQTVELYFVVRLRNSLLPTCGHPTVWTLIRLITAFWTDAEASLPHANIGHGRSEAEVDNEHVGWLPAEYYRRSKQLINGKKGLDACVRAQGHYFEQLL